MYLAVAVAIAGTILLVVFKSIAARRRMPVAVTPDRTELLAVQGRWQAPTELLARPFPRAIRLTPAGKAALWQTLLTLSTGFSAGGVITWLAVRDAVEYRLLARDGVTTTAKILEKREERHRSLHLIPITLRYVTFAFSAGDRTYQGQAGVPLSIFRQIQPGDRMPVRYQASNPAHKRLLVEGEGIAAAVWLAVLALLGCALVLTFAWRDIRPLLIQRRALAWGQPAGAMVVRISRKKKRTKLAYEFLDRAGNVVRGRARVQGARTFMPRHIITVLYEEENSSRNTLYPTPLVQISEVR
jgi:uncharacterized protein DUF3592